MNGIPHGFRVEREAAGNRCATFPTRMSSAHFSHVSLRQFCLRVRAARLIRHLGQAVCDSMPRIGSSVAPFKIIDVVVRRVAVFVVDVRQAVRVWNVGHCDGTMHEHAEGFPGRMEIDAFVRSAPRGIELRQPPPTISADAAITADLRFLQVRPDATVFGNGIKPFIPRNISHLLPISPCARGCVTT